jgi:glutathione peroxidase-family protein
MNYEAAIELAKQRMRELGKTPEAYHLEVVAIVGTASERSVKSIKVKAYNQLYFLVNSSSYQGLKILGDTGYFNSDDYTNNTTQEFTGLIEITQIVGKTWTVERLLSTNLIQTPIEFIKVTMF